MQNISDDVNPLICFIFNQGKVDIAILTTFWTKRFLSIHFFHIQYLINHFNSLKKGKQARLKYVALQILSCDLHEACFPGVKMQNFKIQTS